MTKELETYLHEQGAHPKLIVRIVASGITLEEAQRVLNAARTAIEAVDRRRSACYCASHCANYSALPAPLTPTQTLVLLPLATASRSQDSANEAPPTD